MLKSEVMMDYKEIIVLLGYLSLFSSSLPIVAALAWLTIHVESKVDSLKYSHLVQRSFPQQVKDIGIWT